MLSASGELFLTPNPQGSAEYRFSWVDRSPTRPHNQLDQHSRPSVPQDPIPDLLLAKEEICERLEQEIMYINWLKELGDASDDQLAERANFEHQLLSCLTILRHD